MDNSPKSQRRRSLKSPTSNALHQTLSGFVALIKYKLDSGFQYVLPGKDQSDRLEGDLAYTDKAVEEITTSQPTKCSMA